MANDTGFGKPRRPNKSKRTHVTTNGYTSATPREAAVIHIYRALNLKQKEIAEKTGISIGRVQTVLQQSADRVRDGEDPIDVYEDVMAPVNDPLEPSAGGDD